MAQKKLRTRLCDKLGIEYPIVLAGMGDVAAPAIVAAVSEAGGLGVLGASLLDPDQIVAWIRETRKLTKKPFGVDLLVPMGLAAEGSAGEFEAQLPPQHVAFMANLKKELGLPDAKGVKWGLSEDFARRQLQAVVDERPAVFACGLGSPEWVISKAKQKGITVMGIVGNVKNACRVAERGADVIVAQGYEGGGHTGRVGTLALIPQVVDAVSPVPVVAAGGIGDGRGLAAALVLGATGVWVGTAFIATKEACVGIPEVGIYSQSGIDNWKRKIVEATEEDTRVTKAFTGKTSRQLKNKFIEAWDKSGLAPLPLPHQFILVADLMASLREAGMNEWVSGFSGQVCGMIKEIKTAKQVVDDMVGGAIEVLERKIPADVKMAG